MADGLPKPEKRKPLTRVQFATLILKQEGRCGCGCGTKLQADRIIDEHVVALDFLGSNDLSNRSLWDKDCSRRKTSRDIAAAAKGKRLRQAAEKPPCIVEGCERPSRKGGLCNRHYMRQWKYGDALAGGSYCSPPGEKLAFIESLVGSSETECTRWPFRYNSDPEYADVWYEGRTQNAHRVLCRLAHGEPPFDRAHAAHGCGNDWCLNPNHLRWATPAENEADKKLHGTAYGNGTPKKLTALDVEEIRNARGKRSQREIAKEYGIHQVTVSEIQTGKIWNAGQGPKKQIPSRPFMSMNPSGAANFGGLKKHATLKRTFSGKVVPR